MKLGKENDIEDLEFESDSDEAGSDLDMSQIPEDREAEDSDEVLIFSILLQWNSDEGQTAIQNLVQILKVRFCPKVGLWL